MKTGWKPQRTQRTQRGQLKSPSPLFTLLFSLFVAAAAAALSGCMAISPEDAADAAVAAKGFLALPTTTQALALRVEALEDQARLTYGLVGALAAKEGVTATDARDWAAEQDPAPEEEEEAPADEENPDSADFSAFQWKFGGVDGSKAKLDSPRVADLRASASSLSYKWEVGLRGWGLANSQADALACLFVERSDGTIVGGKFDWVSTSRRTRDLKNVFGGYQKWSLEGVPNPCRIHFVVLSADGRKRSNVVSATWQR